MKNPYWVDKLMEIVENPNKPEKIYREKYDLNEVAFQRIKSLEKNKKTIGFCKLRTELCRIFSIKKGDLMKLLKRFESEGKIIFIKQKGIKIC